MSDPRRRTYLRAVILWLLLLALALGAAYWAWRVVDRVLQ